MGLLCLYWQIYKKTETSPQITSEKTLSISLMN